MCIRRREQWADKDENEGRERDPLELKLSPFRPTAKLECGPDTRGHVDSRVAGPTSQSAKRAWCQPAKIGYSGQGTLS